MMRRKNLYQDRYEYDNPMFYRGVAKFEIVPAAECDLDNPWKESFQQLVSLFFIEFDDFFFIIFHSSNK